MTPSGGLTPAWLRAGGQTDRVWSWSSGGFMGVPNVYRDGHLSIFYADFVDNVCRKREAALGKGRLKIGFRDLFKHHAICRQNILD